MGDFSSPRHWINSKLTATTTTKKYKISFNIMNYFPEAVVTLKINPIHKLILKNNFAPKYTLLNSMSLDSTSVCCIVRETAYAPI